MSPTYAYKCPRCSAVVEQIRAIDQDADAPICGDCLMTMERNYSAPAVIFKGNGWGGKP